ncbi:MAG: N-formylglutamate amidohydrolase [Sphingomonas sp.]
MAHAALPFDIFGDAAPRSPIILSVPHAGRDYPLALRAALRVPVGALLPLEDRHVDMLALAARGHETVIVQRLARAWIDLNRAEHERDPVIDEGAQRQAAPHASAKVRGGLGLVPRRVPGCGEIWRRPLDGMDVSTRIERDYRPYHGAVARLLSMARARYGCAILLDLHSMPPLGAKEPRIVLGDRFGRSAGGRFVRLLEDVCVAHGARVALNAPYAGGHILDRHACPAGNIHAIQVEFDRSLYLDPALDGPGDGFGPAVRMLRAMIDALADEASALPEVIAAE